MGSTWTTADYAFVVSMFSATIALISLGWNVWSKFIFPKPKVRVTMSLVYCDLNNQLVITEVSPGVFPGDWEKSDLTYPSVRLSATNFGPGKVKLQVAIAQKSRFYQPKNKRVGLLNPYQNYPSDMSSSGPYSGGLPAELDVGEDFDAHFPVSERWFTQDSLAYFGFVDSFGRKHYTNYRNVRAIRRQIFHHTKAQHEQTI